MLVLRNTCSLVVSVSSDCVHLLRWVLSSIQFCLTLYRLFTCVVSFKLKKLTTTCMILPVWYAFLPQVLCILYVYVTVSFIKNYKNQIKVWYVQRSTHVLQYPINVIPRPCKSNTPFFFIFSQNDAHGVKGILVTW